MNINKKKSLLQLKKDAQFLTLHHNYKTHIMCWPIQTRCSRCYEQLIRVRIRSKQDWSAGNDLLGVVFLHDEIYVFTWSFCWRIEVFFFQLHKILKNKQEIGGNIWLKWNSFKKAEWHIGYIPANTLNSFINHSDNLYSRNPRSLFHSIINFKVNSPQQFQRKLKILKQVCSWSSVVKSLFTSNV